MDDIMKIPAEYELQVNAAKEFLKTAADADGVFAALCRNGEIVKTEVFTDEKKRIAAEDIFIDSLTKGNTGKIERSVFIWKDGTFDVLSGRLLKALVQLDQENRKAKHLVKGNGLSEKTYESLLPA